MNKKPKPSKFQETIVDLIKMALTDNDGFFKREYEDNFRVWMILLFNGEKIFRSDWAPEYVGEKYLFLDRIGVDRKGFQLFIFDHGVIRPYDVTDEDLDWDEWYGIGD